MNYAIIAAGEGSRLVTEGVTKPKPLVELNGEPLLGRLIRIFTENKAESVSVIVNEEMREVKDYLDGLKLNCRLNVVVKTTPSSMHSFYELSKVMCEGRFCLTTIDTVFSESDFARYIEAFEKNAEIDGLMAVTPFVDDEKPLYVGVDDDMKITTFADKPHDGAKYVSGGVYALDYKSIEVLRRCVEAGMLRMRNFQRSLIDEGLKLRAYAIDKIVDIDHASDIKVAEEYISALPTFV